MRFSGHTPLCRMPAEKVSPQQQALLSSLWVESVEEFTAMMAAMEAGGESADQTIISPLKQSESALLEGLPEEVVAPWRQASVGGGLGCRIEPETLEMYRIQGRVSLPGSIMPQLSDLPLPPSVRLMDKLFPVRNQGHRGTCVAFSSVGLREYLDCCSTELSEQFLYWACKQIDGFPDEPGTLIRTAMSALSTKGACPLEVWPYNPQPQPGNESQAPPPAGAQDAALGYRMPYTRSVAQNCVNHYKHVLSGVDGLGPMPVVIGSLVFNSWYRSAATHQSGKITMPLPGEQPLSGGHAMLIVGYQDDSSVPGGGYFIVRNSWGEKWAAVSPEAPGHALMPYAYVERYIVEAFSGQSMMDTKGKTLDLSDNQADAKTSANTFDEQYIETLRRERRDVERKLLSAGTRVIRRADTPGEFMADTPENRRIFKERGFAWSDTVRQSSYFPPRSQWNSDLQKNLNAAQQRCRQFCSAIDQNIRSSVGKSMPDVNLSPWLFALPYMPKIRKVEQAAGLTDSLIEQICRQSHAPEGVSPSKDWAEALRGIQALCIYTVTGPFGRFHVVSAFVSPMRFSSSSQPELAHANAGVLDAVQSLYGDWAKQHQSVNFTFYTVGTSLVWPDDMAGISSGDHLLVFSAPSNDGRWDTSSPPQFASRIYLRNFLDRLYPETSQQRVSRIKDAVDRYISEGYEGNILLDKIAKDTGYRRTWIRRAFRAMQDSGHYECYRTDHQVAIRKRIGRGGITLRSEPGAFVKYHLGLLSSAIVGVLGWQCLAYLTTGAFQLTGLLVVPLFLYAGKCIEITAKRNQSDI